MSYLAVCSVSVFFLFFFLYITVCSASVFIYDSMSSSVLLFAFCCMFYSSVVFGCMFCSSVCIWLYRPGVGVLRQAHGRHSAEGRYTDRGLLYKHSVQHVNRSVSVSEICSHTVRHCLLQQGQSTTGFVMNPCESAGFNYTDVFTKCLQEHLRRLVWPHVIS